MQILYDCNLVSLLLIIDGILDKPRGLPVNYLLQQTSPTARVLYFNDMFNSR